MADAADVTFSASPLWGLRLRAALAWIAVGLLLVALFTVLTFPYEALHARLLSEVARQTGATVQIDVRRPVRLLGIEWMGVRFSQGDRPVGTIPRAIGVLSWLDAFQGKPVVYLSLWFEDQSTNPTVSAKAAFTDWSFQRVAAIDGAAERVDLYALVGPPVRSGRAKVAFRFEGGRSASGPLEGDVQLEVSDLAIEQITTQGVRVPEWGFASVRSTLQCGQHACRIDGFTANGPDGAVVATGQIVLGSSTEDAHWDVGVTLTSSPAFSQRTAAVGGFPLPAGTPFRVKLLGPLLRPQFAL